MRCRRIKIAGNFTGMLEAVGVGGGSPAMDESLPRLRKDMSNEARVSPMLNGVDLKVVRRRGWARSHDEVESNSLSD